MYSGSEKIDRVLEFYVRLAEETGYVSIAVTLNIHGLILTGRIITANQYFDEIVKEFKKTRIQMTSETEIQQMAPTAGLATPTILHEIAEERDENEPEDEYVIDLTKEEFQEKVKEKMDEVKDTMLSELTGEYLQFMDKIKQEEDHSIHEDGSPSSQSPIEYIHLDDVIAYPVGSDFPYKMNVWRGKLSAVDGFSIGGTRPEIVNL